MIVKQRLCGVSLRLSLGSYLKRFGHFVESYLEIVQFFIGLLIWQSSPCLFAWGASRSSLDVSGDLFEIFVETYDLVRHLLCQFVKTVNDKSAE